MVLILKYRIITVYISEMPNYSVQIFLQDTSFAHYMAYASKAGESFNWNTIFVSDTGMQMESPFSLAKNTYGEKISITLINSTTVEIKSLSKGNVLIDFGRNRKNVNALLAKIDELKRTSAPGEIQIATQDILNKTAAGEEELLNPESKLFGQKQKWWQTLIPSKKFFVTPLLIIVNTVLFIAMVLASGNIETLFQPTGETLLTWGSNYKPVTLDGQWWRIFTCMFEHIGVLHLVLNMYALIYVGLFLEPLLGKLKFLVLYIATGLLASLASLWWNDNVNSAGASGAIFGMYGVFLALLLSNVIEKEIRAALLPSIGIFITLNLVAGTKAGIDNAAHIGGLLSGIIFGFLVIVSTRKRENKSLQAFIIALIVGITFTTVVIALPRLKNPMGEYNVIIKEFQQLENSALKVYELAELTSPDSTALQIQNITIPNFIKCRALVERAEKIDLPEELRPLVFQLGRYVEVRLEEAALRKKALEENTDKYNDQIIEKDTEIKRTLDEINK